MAGETNRVVAFYPTDELPTNKDDLRIMMSTLAESAMEKLFGNSQEAAAKFALKFGSSMLAGGAVAKSLGGLTPFQWILKGFGAMPKQFLSYRSAPVLEFTTGQKAFQTYRGAASFIGGNGARLMIAELSLAQRAATVARVVGARFVLVTIAFEGGYYIGTLINENVVEDDTQNLIGGTIYQIVNEGGWRLALPDVIREGLGISPFKPTLDLSEM